MLPLFSFVVSMRVVIESVMLIQSPRPDGMVGFLKLNYQALFGTSLDP